VLTAEFDPLRDEGEADAKRLEDAGVPTDCRRYDGMIHNFVAMARLIPAARPAIEAAAAALRAGHER
jgi:acetyl esterase